MTNRRRNPRTSDGIDKELEDYEKESQRGIPTTPAPSIAPSIQRAKLGWQIRMDLKKACQQIALDENRKDYEVLEMLLDEALAARNRGKKVEK